MTSFLATPPVTADVGSDAELACSILLQKKAQVAQARGNIRDRVSLFMTRVIQPKSAVSLLSVDRKTR